MKYSLLIGIFASLVTFPGATGCKTSKEYDKFSSCMKGRLEIAGICRNYTISVQSGNIDTSKVEASWTDPSTNKTYQNVFKLGSLCSFPNDIKAGDEFYFTVTDTEDKDCVNCMAYYPTPEKMLYIKVQKSGCDSN